MAIYHLRKLQDVKDPLDWIGEKSVLEGTVRQDCWWEW